MPGVGGSVTSISFNGRQFAAPADADFSLKLGGYENEIQPNGDGSGRLIKIRVPWGITGVSLSIDDSKKDLEFLQQIADEKTYSDIVTELASGAVYSGRGTIVGEVTMATANAAGGFDISGPGKTSQQ